MDILQLSSSRRPLNKAVWAKPTAKEAHEGAPEKRIIHSRVYSSSATFTLKRLGIKMGAGYFKCGSDKEEEYCSSLRLIYLENDQWITLDFDDHSKPAEDEILWLTDLNIETTAFVLEMRKSSVDEWWTSWNLAMTGVVMESSLITPLENNIDLLKIESISGVDEDMISSVGAASESDVLSHISGDVVHYRCQDYQVAFNLRHPSFSEFKVFSLEDHFNLPNQIKGSSVFLIKIDNQTGKNEEGEMSQSLAQGPKLWLVGEDLEAGYCHSHYTGSTIVKDNTVTYLLDFYKSGIKVKYTWTIKSEGMTLETERSIPEDRTAIIDTLWSTVFDSSVTPSSTLGNGNFNGETGGVDTPLLFHSPKGGNFKISQSGEAARWRYDSMRTKNATSAEWQMNEKTPVEGIVKLKKGTYKNTLEWKIDKVSPILKSETPDKVKKAIEYFLPTAFAYKPDIGSLSNNSTSIQCIFCVETWIELYLSFPSVHGLSTWKMMDDTLTRWLDGGPSYASGRKNEDEDYKDEYPHSTASPLYGLSKWISLPENEAWAEKMLPKILEKIDVLKSLDLDGDGLIESNIRQGNSGEHQWSSNWWDVISFGYKDAFSNSSMFALLSNFALYFDQVGRSDLAEEMRSWASKAKESFHQTFYNPETGCYGGWRDKKGVLHDHGFLFVNGAAVSYGIAKDDLGKKIIQKLYRRLEDLCPPYHLGIPGNLVKIPNEDLAPVMHDHPYGWYQNGGLTISQSLHFMNAMYKVGMTNEADKITERMARGLATGDLIGGNDSGVDWRLWNGSPSGYEGILVDQLGILSTMMNRWGVA